MNIKNCTQKKLTLGWSRSNCYEWYKVLMMQSDSLRFFCYQTLDTEMIGHQIVWSAMENPSIYIKQGSTKRTLFPINFITCRLNCASLGEKSNALISTACPTTRASHYLDSVLNVPRTIGAKKRRRTLVHANNYSSGPSPNWPKSVRTGRTEVGGLVVLAILQSNSNYNSTISVIIACWIECIEHLGGSRISATHSPEFSAIHSPESPSVSQRESPAIPPLR